MCSTCSDYCEICVSCCVKLDCPVSIKCWIRLNINYIYDDGKFVGTSSPDGGAGISANAMAGKEGVWTHTSYRADKSDCHPQNELIERLMGLEAYRKT